MKDTVRPRMIYCSLFCWMSITGGRFLAPFLEHEAGFSDSSIGIALASQYGILSLLSPIYGHFADAREHLYPHYGRGHVLLVGVSLGTFFFWLHGLGHVCRAHWLLDTFWYHFLVQILYATCFCTLFPVLDGMTLDYLQRHTGHSMDYGKERLFGTFSWGVTNVIFGALIDKFGFAVAYPCALAACIYSIVTILIYSHAQASLSSSSSSSVPSGSQQDSNEVAIKDLIPNNQREAKHQQEDTALSSYNEMKQHQPSSWVLVKGLLGTIYGAAFVFCYFLLNNGFSVVENMVFLFFEFLGGSNTICGLTVALTVSLEIPIFQIAPNLLRTHGVGSLLIVANVAFLIRVIGYTLIPQGQTWLVFLLEPLHGFTYAGAQSSAVEFVNQNMPEGAEASGQGIVNLIRGSGSVLGLWMGGVLQDSYGPRVMYRVFAAAVTVGVTLFGVVRSMYRQEEEYGRIDIVNLTV